MLDSTPPVLSIGRRCQLEAFFFWRPPYGKPVLTAPSEKEIALIVEGHVPFLVDKGASPAVPSPSEDESDDHWLYDGRKLLIRVHMKPRSTLFAPSDASGSPIPISDLSGDCISIMRDTRYDGAEVEWGDRFDAPPPSGHAVYL